MELNKNLTNTNRGKGMKTFKQHVKEGMDRGKYGAGNVGVETSNAVEDSTIGVHNIQDPDVLKRVNAISNGRAVLHIQNGKYLIYNLCKHTIVFCYFI